MHYVYLIRSQIDPEETYIGMTADLKARIAKHNEGGGECVPKTDAFDLVEKSLQTTRDR